MQNMVTKLMATLVGGALLPLFAGGVIESAHAKQCVWDWHSTSTYAPYSSVMNSSSTCDNLWAARTASYDDYIRGQYNNRDGTGWHNSDEGWKFVKAEWSDVQKKVVRDTTVPGERDRGVAYSVSQQVRYAH